MSRLHTLLLVSIVTAAAVQAQDLLGGQVVDEETGEVIVGAAVWIPLEQRGVSTDVNGRFQIRIQAGTDPVLRIQSVGYGTLERKLSELVRTEAGIVVRLVQQPILMGETVVSASRREQSLAKVPVSVSTIGPAELSNRMSLTLEEPLRYVSGVNVMDDQINIRGSSGYSRGVGSRVLLLFDGVPLLTGDTGEIIWEMVPVDQIDRVEVVKGAGSALYGSSAMGGVINIIPSRIPEGTHAAFRASGGVYDEPPHREWRWSDRLRTVSQGSALFSVGTQSWGTVCSIARWMDESYRQNDVVHRYAIYNRTRLSLGDAWSADVSAHYVRRRGGEFFWWKSLRSPLVPPDDYAARHVLSDRGFVSATIRGVHSSHTASSFRIHFYSNAWSDEDAGVVVTEARSTRTFAEAELTTELLPGYHMVVGIDAYLDQVQSDIFGKHPGLGVAAFLQNEYSILPNLDFSYGIRFDWQQVSGLPSGSQFDPRLGVSYQVSERLSVRASLGEGFRYPSIGELYTSIATGFGGVNVVPNPNLEPELSISYEVGTRYQYSRSGSMDLAAFRSDYDGLIEAAVDAKELVIRFVNVEKARIQGFELSMEQFLSGRALSIRGGYTFMDPREDSTNKVLRFRPKHVVVGGLRYDSGPLSATLEYRYVSRIEEIDENLVTVAAIKNGNERGEIHSVNLRGTWSLDEWDLPLRLGFEIRNLTNHQYVELLANLAPPRTYMVTLEGWL